MPQLRRHLPVSGPGQGQRQKWRCKRERGMRSPSPAGWCRWAASARLPCTDLVAPRGLRGTYQGSSAPGLRGAVIPPSPRLSGTSHGALVPTRRLAPAQPGAPTLGPSFDVFCVAFICPTDRRGPCRPPHTRPPSLLRSGEFWIQCDGCDRWFDGKCVGMTSKKANEQPQWKCPLCP